jgi:hypothetical protein
VLQPLKDSCGTRIEIFGTSAGSAFLASKLEKPCPAMMELWHALSRLAEHDRGLERASVASCLPQTRSHNPSCLAWRW